MASEIGAEAPCLERLYREASSCLETFPGKISELNDFVNEYMPDSVRESRYNENAVERTAKCRSAVSTARNCDLNSISDYGVSSYYSLSMCDRSRSRHGISKRRYYRSRGFSDCNGRRRPGPLGQLLALLVNSLAICTRRIVITPSQYILENIIPMFLHRRELRNAQCGPSTNWNSSLSTFVTASKRDTTVIGRLMEVLRPAVVKLIADTTILKRWLQAIALNDSSPPIELTNATRNTETIDCWAYELFFHLKFLQVNRAQRTTDHVIVEAETKPDDVVHANLWHRLVQLRDNYIILYDVLQTYEKTRDLDFREQQE